MIRMKCEKYCRYKIVHSGCFCRSTNTPWCQREIVFTYFTLTMPALKVFRHAGEEWILNGWAIWIMWAGGAGLQRIIDHCDKIWYLWVHNDRTGRGVKGAPPFSIEIMRPSTRNKDRNKGRNRDRSKDLLLKACKYHSAGVVEYRIADPENRKVIHHTCIWAAGAPAFYSHEEKEK